MTDSEARLILTLACGRLFRMGTRPTEPGDVETYARIRSAALEAADHLGIDLTDNRPNYARQHRRGAPGD